MAGYAQYAADAANAAEPARERAPPSIERVWLTEADIAELPDAIARSNKVQVAGTIPIIEIAMKGEDQWRTLPAKVSKELFDKYSSAEDAQHTSEGRADEPPGDWYRVGAERSVLIEGIWCDRMVQSGDDCGSKTLIRIGWVRHQDLQVKCSQQFLKEPPRFWLP